MIHPEMRIKCARRQGTRDVVRLLLSVGGGKSCFLPHSAHREILSVGIDAAGEVEKLSGKFTYSNLLFEPIGEEETLHQLLPKEEVLKPDAIANLVTFDGSGAMPLVSQLLVDRYIESDRFRRFMDQLISRIVTETAGNLRLLDLLFVGSIAGGWCAGSCINIMRAMTTSFGSLGVPIRVQGDFLGPLAYNTLSSQAIENAAGVMPHFAAYFSSCSLDEVHVSKLAVFSEAPPTGQNIDLRHKFLSLEYQAISSVEFEEQFNLVRPNLASFGRYADAPLKGNILRRRTEIIASLKKEGILSEVAHIAERKIGLLIAQCKASRLATNDVRWDDVVADHHKTDIDRICDNALNYDAEELVTLLTTPRLVPDQNLLIALTDDSIIDPDSAANEALSCEHTFGGILHHVATLSGIVSQLDSTINDLTLLKSSAEEEINDARASFVASHRKLSEGSGWIDFLVREDPEESLREAAISLDENARSLEVTSERLELATALKNQCSGVRDSLLERLTAVQNALRKFKRGNNEEMQGILMYPREDQMLKSLWNFDALTAEEKEIRLASLATGVHLRGLARLLNVKSLDYDLLARRIVTGHVELAAPSLGGRIEHKPGTKYYSLPKLRDEDRDAIRDAIKRLDRTANVVECDSHEAGVAVLRICFHQSFDTKDVLRGAIGNALPSAHRAPNSQMVTIGGDEALRALNIKLGE